MFALDQPSFSRDGADWPLREHSRFVEAGGVRWHVQRLGAGPPLLLLHGAGGATHSWRGLAPLLAPRFELLSLDLPGHGFTEPGRAEVSIPGLSNAVAALLGAEAFAPAIVVGHSAGAAIAAKLCLDGAISPQTFVGINAALTPFPGFAGVVFPPLARLMNLNPLWPRLFSWSADREAVARLIAGMGSKLDTRGLELYARLLSKSGHCAGTLAMMANWRLDKLSPELPKLKPSVLLIVGAKDRAVPPADARRISERLAGSRVVEIPNVGHLAHEENPEAVAELI